MNKSGIIKLSKLPELFQDFKVVALGSQTFYILNYGAWNSFTKTSIQQLMEYFEEDLAVIIPNEIGDKLQALRESDLNLAMVLIEGLKITYKNETEELHSKLKEMYERAI